MRVQGDAKAATDSVSITIDPTTNGFAYRFDVTDQTAHWSKDGLVEFKYILGDGTWQDWDKFGGWTQLSGPGLSAAFMGDGNVHTLDSSWSYQFVNGVGYWTNLGLSQPVFEYNYASGQWYDEGNYGGYLTLRPQRTVSVIYG